MVTLGLAESPALPRAMDIGAAILFGIAGVIILSVQPLVFGPLVAEGSITESQLGQIAGLETAGIALSSALLPGWLSRDQFRVKVAVLALVMALCNLATPSLPSFAGLLAVRTACGLAEGGILAGAFLVLFARGDPERMNALFLAVSNSFVAAVSYLIPMEILPSFGTVGSFFLMAAVGLVALLSVLAVRHRPVVMATPVTGWRQWPTGAYLVLLAIMLQNAAIISGWVFLESTARANGFGNEALALSASLGIMAQVLGAASVALFGYRLPAGRTLVVGSLVLAGAVYWLGHPTSPLQFILANMVMGFCWLSLLPLSIKLICEIEREKQALYLTAASQMAGLSLGPLVAANFVSADNVRPAYLTGLLLGLGAALLFAIARRSPGDLEN